MIGIGHIKTRNESSEKLKSNFRSVLDKINPFGTVTGRSFKMPIRKDVVSLIEDTVKARHKGRQMTGREKKAIFAVLNWNDTKDSLTILAQELIKDGKAKCESPTKLLSAIKLACASSVCPPGKKKERNELAVASPKMADAAVELAQSHGETFATELKEALDEKEIYDKEQDVVSGVAGPLRNYYWNRYVAVAKVIGKEMERLGVEEALAASFVLSAKYQVVAKEVLAYIATPKKSEMVQKIGYTKVLGTGMNYYHSLNTLLVSNGIRFTASYLTHISEPEGRINLSDLEKLTLTGYLSVMISYLLMMAWAVVILFPLFQMVIFSFDGSRISQLGEAASVSQPDWIHYSNLFANTNFKYWLGNSLEVAASTMVLTVVITTLMAYAFSRFKFRGKKTSLLSIMLLQLIPSVAALTAFSVLYLIMKEGIKTDVRAFLIVIYTGGALTGNTFILKGYMDSIPRDLDEAAELDGAGKFKVFWSILVPLSKPMIAIVALWSFIGPFGDVILPNLLNDGTLEGQKSLTMAAGLRTLITAGQGGVILQYEYLAGAIITSVPIAIMFMLCQKFLVGGLTAGAVK